MDSQRTPRCALALAAGLAGVLAACAGPPPADPTATGGSPSASAACPDGDPTSPPSISDLRLASGSANANPAVPPELTVPFTGIGLVEVSVATDTAGAPVTFATTRGHLVESADTPTGDWLGAPSSLTVYSAPTTAGPCRAVVFFAATQTGRARVTVSAANAKTFVVRVITVPEAARTVEVETNSSRVVAGAEVQATVAVRDGFGNPVFSMPVEVTVDGPGRLAPTGARTTVTTDQQGRAIVRLLTARKRSGQLTVRARLAWGGCTTSVADGASVGSAQVECAAGVPVLSFAAGVRDAAVQVDVAAPSLELLTPEPGSQLSQGQAFEVRARTAGVAPGTPARLLLGGLVVADGVVTAGSGNEAAATRGEIAMQTVAELDANGAGYSLEVGDLAPTIVPAQVRPFAITRITRAGRDLAIEALPGALPTGAVVRLLRGTAEVDAQPVEIPGLPVEFTLPARAGLYNIAATTPDGSPLLGATPQRVTR